MTSVFAIRVLGKTWDVKREKENTNQKGTSSSLGGGPDSSGTAAGPLTEAEVELLRIRLSDGLHRAHEASVIHRDISPDNVILPGGSVVASHLHLARTVCRHAERNVVRLSRNEDIGYVVIIYLNRLSDLLFVMARYANYIDGNEEIKWVSGKRTVKK